MKKHLRQMGWFLGIGPVLLLLCVGMEHVRGRHALNSRLRELRAKGEKLTVAELEPRHPPTDQNAASALLALTNEISQLHSNLSVMPPAGRFAAPGRMMVPWQFEAWSEDGKTNDWTRLIRTLEKSKNLLDSLHAALQRERWDAGFDYQKGFSEFHTPPIVAFKRAAQLLNAAAACDLKEGHTTAALERVTDAIRLVRLQKEDRLIISQLVRIACAVTAWNSAWQLLQTNTWGEPDLVALQTAWQGMDFSADMTTATEVERAMTLDSFKFLASSSAHAESQVHQWEATETLLGGEFSSLPTHGALLYRVHLPLWRTAWADQDSLRSLDRWQELIEMERIAGKESWAATKARVKRLVQGEADNPWMQGAGEGPSQNVYDRWRYLLSNQSFGVGGGMVRRAAQMDTARRMMITVLALKRYQLHHGQPAATLGALAPELLPAVPIDGMDGKPLRYRLNPDGTFILYSVGEDGEDNGGDFTLAKGKARFSQIWDGKDAVWPSLATPEEATKAAWRK